jgi:hypothetical protein
MLITADQRGTNSSVTNVNSTFASNIAATCVVSVFGFVVSSAFNIIFAIWYLTSHIQMPLLCYFIFMCFHIQYAYDPPTSGKACLYE